MSHLYLCDGGLRLRARIACILREKRASRSVSIRALLLLLVLFQMNGTRFDDDDDGRAKRFDDEREK